MLKWNTFNVVIGTALDEVIPDVLAGMSGKNRVIKWLGSPQLTGLDLRAYRDAEQMVNVSVTLFTTTFRLLAVDIPLAEGQLCKAGFKDTGAGTATYKLIVGYEESG